MALCDLALAQGREGAMRRAHRMVHRALWPALALLVLFGFAMALVLRPPPDADAPAAAEPPP
jgi:hypothetical protein